MTNILNLEQLNMVTILAQIWGFCGIISIIISYNMHTKEKVLIWQFIANLMHGIQYIMLNALSAGFLSFLAIYRCYVYYEYHKHKEKIPFFICALFFSMALLIGIVSFKDIYSFLPIITTLLNTYGAWHKNLRVFRIFAVIISICWIIYNIHVLAYIGIGAAIIELISAIIAIIRLDILKTKKYNKTKSNKKNNNNRNKKEDGK